MNDRLWILPSDVTNLGMYALIGSKKKKSTFIDFYGTEWSYKKACTFRDKTHLSQPLLQRQVTGSYADRDTQRIRKITFY